MKRFIILFVLLLLSINIADAFEDTFQYYSEGVPTPYWYIYKTTGGGSRSLYIDTYGATYSRGMRTVATASTGTLTVEVVYYQPNPSNYWSFTTLYVRSSTNPKIYLRDYDLVEICSTPIDYTVGRQELIIQDGGLYVRTNGVDKGLKDTCAKTPSYIGIEVGGGSGGFFGDWIIDDVSTTGYISGIGTESVSHTLTEFNLNPTNISYGIYTFPFADYTSSSFRNVIQKYNGSAPTTLQITTIKNTSQTGVYHGFTNYIRDVQLTSNDTNYGLYLSYLQKNNITVAQDYFMLVPPGTPSTITFEDSTIIIGTDEQISYTIDSYDASLYNYYIKVYGTSEILYSQTVTAASGVVNWDTTGNNVGIVYGVIVRTDKTAGNNVELAYTIATLSENLMIKGYTYDAQNESILGGVNINFSQGSIWYNTTSNSTTGYYELIDLLVDIPINVNASKVNYSHDNFSFTPLASQIYNINLYLVNNTPTINGTAIGGLVYNYPYHQAIPSATVNIYNATWNNVTTSSLITGWYLFNNLTNDTYYNINATKTGYLPSVTYNKSVVNGSYVGQNILMYQLYTATFITKDSVSLATIQSFDVLFNGTTYNTTTGMVTISNLLYGEYDYEITKSEYYPIINSVLIDSDKIITKTFTAIPPTPPSSSTTTFITPHYVRFVFQNLAGMRYPDTTVKVYQDNALLFTGISGTDGAVGFKLNQTIQYRINFFSVAYGFNKNYTLYPVGTEYIFYPVITSTTLFNNFTYSLVMTATSVDFTWNDPENEVSYLNMTITNTSIYPLYEYFSIVKINASTPSNYYSVHLTNKSANIPATMWYLMNKSDVTADREVSTHFYNTGKTKEFPFWIDHLTAVDNFSVWVNITDSGTSTFRWYFGYNYTNNTDYSSVNTTQNYINLSTLSSPLATKMGNTSFVYNVNSTAHSGTLSYTFDQSTIDYTVRINVTTVNFGVMQIVRTFRVPGYGVQMTGVQDWFVMSIALFFILIVGMMFGYNHASIGALITAGMAVFFSTIGWIQLSDVGKGVIAIAVFIAIVGLLRGRK